MFVFYKNEAIVELTPEELPDGEGLFKQDLCGCPCVDTEGTDPFTRFGRFDWESSEWSHEPFRLFPEEFQRLIRQRGQYYAVVVEYAGRKFGFSSQEDADQAYAWAAKAESF